MQRTPSRPSVTPGTGFTAVFPLFFLLYDGLIAEAMDIVGGVKDIESANAAKDKIITFNHIWDSKLRCGLLLNNKCASLGLKFNKATERYEQAS